MPVIQRDDGVQFAYYTYRELLTAKKSSLLKQEIQLLQKENGNYCRFFTQPNGDYEAVFSRDPGYLLAETIWEHFDKPYDLIYCEQLSDQLHAILVVIRAGSVYLDAKVAIENLPDEFATLITGENQYDIYLFGDIPLSEYPEDDKFSFDKDFVKSFNILEEATFLSAKVNPANQLLPVSQAINELALGKEKIPVYLVVVILSLILGITYWLLRPSTEDTTTVTETPKFNIPKPQPKDPYAQYKQELSSPSPDDELFVVSQWLRKLYTTPGWIVKKVTFTDSEIKAELDSIGGTTEMILAWADLNGADFEVKENIAEITLFLSLPDRTPPKVIYDIDNLMAEVLDRIKLMIPDGSITIGETIPASNYIIAQVTVSLASISIDTLVLMGNQLKELPIVLTGGDFTVEDGLLTGKVDIKIIGANK